MTRNVEMLVRAARARRPRKYLTTQQIIAEHSDVLDHRRWDDPGTQLAWTASALMERRNAALGREQGAVA